MVTVVVVKLIHTKTRHWTLDTRQFRVTEQSSWSGWRTLLVTWGSPPLLSTGQTGK